MLVLDGRLVGAAVKARVMERVKALKAKGVTPCLATVLVGDNLASQTYLKIKHKTCAELGVESKHHHLPESASQQEVLALIEKLNDDNEVTAVLVQLPLPRHLNTEVVCNAIAPGKDVDCVNAQNIGLLVGGTPLVEPCTPKGIMTLLDHYKVTLAGKNAVIVNRSNIVGKPLAHLLLKRDATVTICHSKTRDLEKVMASADVLVAATGKAGFVKKEMVKEGAVVVDVGIVKDSQGRLRGDVDYEDVKEKAGAITPVPRGVGPMTIASLFENVVVLAEKGKGKN
ncbi:MAG TPA: bifunctional 5,10-methylenetetrahydrofolate dehydrogenase/5,10-methenyltetrahydrofolate cyclohydrolase [archaeon]|nr:bifunctional 5,10-methylenetetrahydrofolate dehydrogenase/5,10-methenyltetrahydrofolate cyclohydrolase [archaeon]